MLKTSKQKIMSKIKMLRKRQGLTLQDLHGATGISVSYLSRIEAGSRRLNEDTLNRISTALRCHPADLLGDTLSKREESPFDTFGSTNISPNWVSGSRSPTALDQTIAQFYPMIAGMNNQSRAALLRHALTLSIAQIGGSIPTMETPSSSSPAGDTETEPSLSEKAHSPLSVLQELPVYTQGIDAQGNCKPIDFKNPTRWILRPAELIGVSTAFALEVTSHHLEPKYRAGDVILVNPSRSLSPGCSSIILKKDHQVLVKEYVNSVENKVILREFGVHSGEDAESHNLELSNDDLQSMYRIIGSIENAA